MAKAAKEKEETPGAERDNQNKKKAVSEMLGEESRHNVHNTCMHAGCSAWLVSTLTNSQKSPPHPLGRPGPGKHRVRVHGTGRGGRAWQGLCALEQSLLLCRPPATEDNHMRP